MGKDIPFNFDNTCKESFEKLCTALTSALILCHYYLELETMVETNALDGVIAGIFSQRTAINEPWHLVEYFLKIISPAELNY
jgi:hypothetical protein